MKSNIKNWLKYEKVRRGGEYNMIMNAYSASVDAGLSMDEYTNIINHYAELKHEAEEHLGAEKIDRFTRTNKARYYVVINTNKETIEFETDDFMDRVHKIKLSDGDFIVDGTVLDFKHTEIYMLTPDDNWEFITEEEWEKRYGRVYF